MKDEIRKAKDQRLIKTAFVDIVRGYSVNKLKKFKIFYVKHLTGADISDIDMKRDFYTEKTAKEGMPTNDERIKQCIEEGTWSEAKNSRIRDLTNSLDGLENTRRKLPIERDRKSVQEEIDRRKKEIETLSIKREMLVGFTAEKYAAKKINEYYMFVSLCKDPELKYKYFSEEEFDEVSREEITSLVEEYNLLIQKFEGRMLKKISLSQHFLNLFYLCKDNPLVFFGKPVVKLTFYQTELFGLGVYFKSILSNAKIKPPRELFDDPDRFVDWIESTSNMEKEIEKVKKREAKEGGDSLVGASKEEMERMGKSGEVISLQEEAKKRGKSRLDMKDFLQIHGFKVP